MRRRTALISSLIFCCAGISYAQETVPLPHQLCWAQFEIIDGRLQILSTRYNQTKTRTTESSVGKQTYTVSVSNKQPAALYERVTDTGRTAFEFCNSGEVSIKMTPSKKNQVVVQFKQAISGKITLTIGEKDDRLQFREKTFWRLLIRHPKVCQKHLAPLLEMLRPGWNLALQAEMIEDALIDYAQTCGVIDRKTVCDLVDQLGSNDFPTRASAHRELESMGRPVLVYFDEIDQDKLDFEQKSRMNRIRASFESYDADTPVRIATGLSCDKSIWLAIAGREDERARKVAAVQLARLHGPIEFDPFASNFTRQSQLQRLQEELLHRR